MNKARINRIFEIFKWHGGQINEDGHPEMHAPVSHTDKGIPYLTQTGVAMLGKMQFSLKALKGFLSGFPEELGFLSYLDDPIKLENGEALSKTAGQLCYMSFGPKRTKNADADKYFENIRSSGHGSVLEHPNYSFLIYGNSRSETHEAVRHRSGFGYSQVSQRYVSGKVLRFVERREFQRIPKMHERFMRRVEFLWNEYHEIAEELYQLQSKGEEVLRAEAKTDLRKKVQQVARAVLPNETEAPIIATGNVRAWRHFIEMRANEHAETEIRGVAFRIFLCLAVVEPLLFEDYEIEKLTDGTSVVKTKYRKV